MCPLQTILKLVVKYDYFSERLNMLVAMWTRKFSTHRFIYKSKGNLRNRILNQGIPQHNFVVYNLSSVKTRSELVLDIPL